MKKISLILTLILIASALGGGLTSVAFAATSGIESSDVLFDLQNSKIAGENFNVDDYGYTDEKALKVLAFAEYGFAFNKSDSNYAIYLYVYNPSGREIKAQRNNVSVATIYENGAAVDYDKFALKLLSVSDGQYARLFYKFKIADPTKLHTRVSANTNTRRYDVSEIELNFGGETSEAFDVGNYYEYSGYAQGFGADSKAESTLACTTDNIDTLVLKVNSTFYRYDNGMYQSTDLSSVYFGVPKEVFSKYGKLQQVKANWFETHTERQIVLKNLEYYEQLLPYIGVSTLERAVPLGKIENYQMNALVTSMSSLVGDDFYFKYSYTFDGDHRFSGSTARVSNYKLLWLFNSANGVVHPNEIVEYAKNYTNKINSKNLLINKYSSELFLKSVDEGRQYGWQGVDGSGIIIDADSLVTIDGFTTGNDFKDWFTKFVGFKIQDEAIKDIKPIYVVTDKDIEGTASAISQRMLISENDVETFKNTYLQNKLEGKNTVLFRFASSNYVSIPLNAGVMNQGGTGWSIADGKMHVYNVGYVAQQTAFLDFDIIWLKFLQEAQATVIPCVSSPIDVFHGLTPPPIRNSSNIWAIIVAVVIVVLLVILAFKMLKVVFKKRSKK